MDMVLNEGDRAESVDQLSDEDESDKDKITHAQAGSEI
jgi:hypothetical protein